MTTAHENPSAAPGIASGRSANRAAVRGQPVTEAPLNVTFLTVMPSPYVQDLFEAMHADGRIRPRVYYLEMEAPDTYWGRRELPPFARVVPGKWFGVSGARVHWNPGVAAMLRREPGDVVVVAGYSGITNQVVMRSLTRAGRPWVFWGERPGMQSRGALGRAIRSLAQGPIRSASGVAAIGSKAVEAYRGRVPVAVPVTNLPYFCDMEPFLRCDKAPRTAGEPVRFLYCGQLIERKGVDLLLGAFGELCQEGREARLTLVGEGPMRAAWEAGLSDAARGRVGFAGFQPVGALPGFFARADVFVLPSRHDGWGVVVNQAIAAGLPVVASDAVGAADLVEPDGNGIVVPMGDGRALKSALASFADHPEMAVAYGERSRRLALEWTLRRGVDRWYEFLAGVAAGVRP